MFVVHVLRGHTQAAAEEAMDTLTSCTDAVRAARRILDDVLSLSKAVRAARGFSFLAHRGSHSPSCVSAGSGQV